MARLPLRRSERGTSAGGKAAGTGGKAAGTGGKAAGAGGKEAGATGGKEAASRVPASSKRATPKATARYTPPIPRSQKVSPLWVPILMFACLGLGMIIIIANYVNLLPGDDPSNTYLLIGLGLITAGFITATRYH